MSQEIAAVLIAGPTASGKSALALWLARERPSLIVNADSMQVYRDLRILTARPTPADEHHAPHRLYGHVDGAVNYSVGRYLADADAALREAQSQNLLPIFVGGTGLYFKALAQGLSEIPPVSAAIRDRIRRESEGQPTEALHVALGERDPESAARLRPNDRLRVQRALEVFAATGQPIGAFHGRRRPGPLDRAPTIRVFLAPERSDLRSRIDTRFRAMVEQGALEEARALGLRGLDPMLPVMRAHGVPGLLAHLRGELSLEEAILRGQADTRRYAKRQFTWFRHQMPGWSWVALDEAEAKILEAMDQSRQVGPS